MDSHSPNRSRTGLVGTTERRLEMTEGGNKFVVKYFSVKRVF